MLSIVTKGFLLIKAGEVVSKDAENWIPECMIVSSGLVGIGQRKL